MTKKAWGYTKQKGWETLVYTIIYCNVGKQITKKCTSMTYDFTN